MLFLLSVEKKKWQLKKNPKQNIVTSSAQFGTTPTLARLVQHTMALVYQTSIEKGADSGAKITSHESPCHSHEKCISG